MSAHESLRLRCSADSPRDAANHLALDVRLPLSLAAMTALALLPRCPCGLDLCVDVSPREALGSLRDLAAREAGAR